LREKKWGEKGKFEICPYKEVPNGSNREKKQRGKEWGSFILEQTTRVLIVRGLSKGERGWGGQT